MGRGSFRPSAIAASANIAHGTCHGVCMSDVKDARVPGNEKLNAKNLPSARPQTRIRLAISSCLLGNAVRFDGNHKLDTYIRDTLGSVFEFVPVCPEVAIGLGVPRPPIRLVGDPDRPQAVGVKDPSLDVTEKLSTYGDRVASELEDICGYILKSRSPSCGMERVKIYGGGAPRKGRGIFAAAFMARRPLVPIEEEGRLGDPVLRENFIERVFAYHRWRQLVSAGLTPGRLVAFHTAHKLTLLAHGTEHYRMLGRLIARIDRRQLHVFSQDYIGRFMEALRHRATTKRHTNVLMHIAGYLKTKLDREDKAELRGLIEDYRMGRLPLIVPLTLLKHHFRRHPDSYIEGQTYLNPHPKELMLQNLL